MKRLCRASSIALIVCALFAPTTLAAASEPDASPASTPGVQPRVRIDVSPPDSPVVPLLRAEIGALGLEAVEAPPASVPSVTVHVVFSRDSLEVRIVDDATGQSTEREVFSAAGGRPMDSRTAVLHAIELLRWHLRFHAGGSSEPGPSAAPIEPEPVTLVTPPRVEPFSDLRLGLLPMAVYSPGGTRLGLGGELDLLLRWGSFGARVFAAGSLVPNGLSVPEGFLEVTPAWGGIQGVALLGSRAGTSLELGGGAAVFASTLRGTANAENLGQSDNLLTFAPLADLRLRQRITPGFGLTLGSQCVVPLRSSRLRVLEREVGRYGQMLVTLGLGVELTVF